MPKTITILGIIAAVILFITWFLVGIFLIQFKLLLGIIWLTITVVLLIILKH